MALTQEQVTLITVAALGKAPGPDHLDYFINSSIAGEFKVNGAAATNIKNLYDYDTDLEAVAAVLEHERTHIELTNGLKAQTDAEFVASVVANLGLGAASGDSLTALLDSGMPRYKALVEFALALPEEAKGTIVTNATGTLDEVEQDLINNVTPTEPTDPSVPGESLRMLTAGADELEGTSANNTFVARGVEQNANGIVTNTFGTGDKIDGQGGVNTLDATIISDYVANGGTTAIRAETENVQNVFLNARAVTTENNVLVDADNMVGVRQWWSNNSDTTLVVENVTTHANTEDVAIGMRSTGNAGRNGDRTESNYEIYFKEDHLVAGQAAGVDRLVFRMMDQDAFDSGKQELEGYALDSLSFQLDGTVHTLTFADPNAADKPNTWAEMVVYLNAALQAQLADLVADNDIEFVPGGTFRDPNGRVGLEIELQVDNITDDTRLTTPENLAAPHLAINFSSSTSENIYRFSGKIDGTDTTDLPITSTIILDDVGRGSDGGYLKVGSMSEGSQGSTGVEVFNVTVQRDSSLSYMVSTNDALRVVNVSNADGFRGDLTLGNNRTGDSNGGYGLENIEVFNASGMRGDVELSALVSNLANHTYTLGAGNDTLNIDVSEQSSAYAQFGLVVDATAGGNNTINVDLVSTGNSNVADNWYANQSALNNITINAGSGNDVIWTQGAGDARISAGRGEDVIYTDNTGDKAVWTLNATSALNDLIGSGNLNVDVGNASILNKLVIRVTYNDQAGGAAAADAETTGFEATVNLANHLNSNGRADINAAVKAAIESDHVLNALLSVKIGPNNSIIIESKVDGGMHANAVQIDAGFLTQNGSVDYTAPAAATIADYFSASDIAAMQDALKATSSSPAATVAQVVSALGNAKNAVDTTYNSTLNQQQAGADSTAGSSNSITFTGGHDAVVLGTGTGADVINIGAGVTNTDKLTLVNFDFAEDRVNFSSLLNTQVFTASVTAGSMATAGVSATGNVNSVNLVNGFAPTALQPQWDTLSNTQVLEALRGTTGADIGGLTNATAGGLIAKANTAFAAVEAAGTVPRTGTIEHLLLLENPANNGEYKVFRVELTWNEATTTAVYSGATELLTMDFGRQVTDVANHLLTGTAAPTNDLSATEYDLEDGLVINTPNEHVQVNVPFGVQADSIGVAIRALDVTFNFAVNQIVTLSTGSTLVVAGDLTVNGGTLDITAGTLALTGAQSGIILNSGLIITPAQAQALQAAGVTFTSESDTPSKIVIKAADGSETEVALETGEKVELTAPEDEDGTWGKSDPIVDDETGEGGEGGEGGDDEGTVFTATGEIAVAVDEQATETATVAKLDATGVIEGKTVTLTVNDVDEDVVITFTAVAGTPLTWTASDLDGTFLAGGNATLAGEVIENLTATVTGPAGVSFTITEFDASADGTATDPQELEAVSSANDDATYASEGAVTIDLATDDFWSGDAPTAAADLEGYTFKLTVGDDTVIATYTVKAEDLIDGVEAVELSALRETIIDGLVDAYTADDYSVVKEGTSEIKVNVDELLLTDDEIIAVSLVGTPDLG